jgi:excisionase family DNA binding protein
VSASLTLRKWFTPPQIAKQLGVSADKVVGWIRAGEIRAINVAARPGGRPRFRVGEADLIAFEQRRSAVPTTPTPRRRKKPANVEKFF